MPSPFPGMNPYLEQADVWPDFHDSYLTYVRESLAPQVSPNYFVRIQEQVFIHEMSDETLRSLGRPDISLNTTPSATQTSRATTTTLVAPARVRPLPEVDEIRQVALEIVDRRNRQAVTVIELLSPSNKYAGPDHAQYLRKVRNYLRTPVNLVELDFLRGGPRMPWAELPDCDYYAIVNRPGSRVQIDCWPIRLRDPLPTIPIPLREGEPEATLDLQAMLHRVYEAAGYEYSIYAGEPEPRLSSEDQRWASTFLVNVPTS
jgi:hypothetical protein